MEVSLRVRWASKMVQVIEGSADQQTIAEADCSSGAREDCTPLRPSLQSMVEITNDQLLYVINKARQNEHKFASLLKKSRNVNPRNSSSIPEHTLPMGETQKRYNFSRKIGTLHESLSLQDSEMYHVKSVECGNESLPLQTEDEVGNYSKVTKDRTAESENEIESLILKERRLRHVAVSIMGLRDTTQKIAADSPKSRYDFTFVQELLKI